MGKSAFYIITIIGHYSDSLDGQTIKTKIVTDELIKKYGATKINTFNTVGGIKALIKVFFKMPSVLKKSSNVIMLPAHNAVRVVTPLLTFWNHFYKRKLHYCVIGGWLPDFVAKRKWLAKKLRKFDCIYVETKTMKEMLEKQEFNNIAVMPNCKNLTFLKSEELVCTEAEPHRLCTFSRVNKNKGIEEAIEAVKHINFISDRVVYTLDIFGQVDEGDKPWFDDLLKSFPSYVSYKGSIPFDKSVETLKDYFALLFPTKYYTEGIPGTIIDAYAAGLPVIASKWLNFDDIIEDEITGFGYEFNNTEALIDLLSRFATNPMSLLKIKTSCLKKYKEFSPEAAVSCIKIDDFAE